MLMPLLMIYLKGRKHIVLPLSEINSKCRTILVFIVYFEQVYFLMQDSIPGRYEAFWKELDYVKHLWKNRQELKIEDAGIAALFGLECFAWYCAGEVVGRGFTFTGYYV